MHPNDNQAVYWTFKCINEFNSQIYISLASLPSFGDKYFKIGLNNWLKVKQPWGSTFENQLWFWNVCPMVPIYWTFIWHEFASASVGFWVREMQISFKTNSLILLSLFWPSTTHSWLYDRHYHPRSYTEGEENEKECEGIGSFLFVRHQGTGPLKKSSNAFYVSPPHHRIPHPFIKL